jgi:hypothetical protein
MIQVQMGVPQGMHEITRLQLADLRDHQCEQRIRGNIEWHAEKNVGTALVHLTGQFSVGHIELEKSVAGHEGHF